MIPNEFEYHKRAITIITNTLQRALQIALVTKHAIQVSPPPIPRTPPPPTTALPIPIPAVKRLPGIETAQHPTSHTYSTSPRGTKSTENVRAHHARPLMHTATWTASDQQHSTLARRLGVAGVACGICMHGGVSQGECGFGSKREMDFALERRGRFVRVLGLRGSRGVSLMMGTGMSEGLGGVSLRGH